MVPPAIKKSMKQPEQWKGQVGIWPGQDTSLTKALQWRRRLQTEVLRSWAEDNMWEILRREEIYLKDNFNKSENVP